MVSSYHLTLKFGGSCRIISAKGDERICLLLDENEGYCFYGCLLNHLSKQRLLSSIQ